jgi:aryl-alcohol dehydrogenase-like predicted oxidoreductase
MTGLPTRTLGRTGFEATVLGFGAMELRGAAHHAARPITPEEADAVLNGVLDSGINYIDTSIDYGESEENIGKFLAHRRDEYFLASKCGCPVTTHSAPGGERPPHTFDRENLVAGIEQSLRRLQTDHLDLVQFHHSPSVEDLEKEGALEVLAEFQAAGKIRFIGSSSIRPNIEGLIDLDVFDVFQIPYSALQRDHEEIISEAARHGAGIVIRGGIARGEPGEGQGKEETWAAFDEKALADLLDGASPTEFMLRFTISHPDLTTTIVGTRNPRHLAENVAAVEKGPLPPDVYAEAKSRFPSPEGWEERVASFTPLSP